MAALNGRGGTHELEVRRTTYNVFVREVPGLTHGADCSNEDCQSDEINIFISVGKKRGYTSLLLVLVGYIVVVWKASQTKYQ